VDNFFRVYEKISDMEPWDTGRKRQKSTFRTPDPPVDCLNSAVSWQAWFLHYKALVVLSYIILFLILKRFDAHIFDRICSKKLNNPDKWSRSLREGVFFVFAFNHTSPTFAEKEATKP
jgi:hypothetical protein